MMKKQRLGEFQLIQRFLSLFPPSPADLVTPAGDDCAVIAMPSGDLLLITTDLLVEGIHFTMDSISPYQLGVKSMAVNLSDIAAMGGIPRFAFLSIAFRKDETLQRLDAIMTGIRDMCQRHGVTLAGGDTTASKRDLIINLCLTGEPLNGRVLKRSGARPGDLIQISGPLGGSAAALSLILSGNGCRDYPQLARCHFTPEPRLATGIALNRIEAVSAMIDISDGLLQDLGHICEMSGTGAIVDADKVPFYEESLQVARGDRTQAMMWALSGGEDYELCWTVHPSGGDRCLEAAFRAGAPQPVTIGTVTDDGGIRVRKNGESWQPKTTGWDHFR